MIKLLIGGSPCTYWSVAQKANREVEAKGMGWELFKNYLIAKEKFNPDFFLYENNKSAAQPIKDQISRELGVELMHINSALVSAQNRQRFYAFNWKVEQPEDRGIKLCDILDTQEAGAFCAGLSYERVKRQKGDERHYEVAPGGKSFCLRTGRGQIYCCEAVGVGYRNRREADGKLYRRYETSGEEKANALTTVQTDSMVCIPHRLKGDDTTTVQNGMISIKGKAFPINLPDGEYIFRHFTPVECERLQTLPDGYTKCVSNTQRRKGLGNGWTAEVIIHILNGALKDVPRDEEIVVLSMYDGIGTGRYCLEKMGFTNVRYYAYEIDPPAMQVALSNYPDIIQLGDAFNLRRDDWELGKTYDDEPSAETREQEQEQTDLSDAPEDIKAEIIENAERLQERENKTEETEGEKVDKKNNGGQATTNETQQTDFDAVAQLRQLATERKALANLRPESDHYRNDVRAIEYAVSVLEVQQPEKELGDLKLNLRPFGTNNMTTTVRVPGAAIVELVKRLTQNEGLDIVVEAEL